jgi:hypothetical protein
MTFADYQKYSRNLRERSHRLAQTILDRAREIGEQELGSGRDMAFLAAHNWLGQAWMTPAQNQAARTILYLERRSYEPSRLADKIVANAWRRLRMESDRKNAMRAAGRKRLPKSA